MKGHERFALGVELRRERGVGGRRWGREGEGNA